MSTATAELFESKRSVLGRAFDILECFAGGEQEQSITALCAHTGLPPATVHWMLANLVEWGAIERAGRGRYRLGRRLWRLGSDVPSSRALKDVARPCLVDLHAMQFDAPRPHLVLVGRGRLAGDVLEDEQPGHRRASH